jgi:hypothetical protein
MVDHAGHPICALPDDPSLAAADGREQRQFVTLLDRRVGVDGLAVSEEVHVVL